ncbi:MAG: GxxExxY protein [Candidatus Omnitrophota bacterium]|nr:GxxExxY protein [Candidatus Omnitrophota bacterium]
MAILKSESLSYKLRGAFFDVYNTLGPSFKESIYHNALVFEFTTQGIPFKEKVRMPIFYKNKQVGIYEPDFVIDNKILIEIKAVPTLLKLFDMQLYYYLKGTPYELGFLVNFGSDKIQIKRRIQDKSVLKINP